MVKNKKIKQLKSDRAFDLVNSIFLGLCVLLVSYPLIYIISASISDHKAVVSGKVWLFPVGFDLNAYRAVFSNKMILVGYANSIIYMVIGTALSVFLTILAAFPLSRKEFYGRNIFMGIFLFTMLFSGGLIPTYLVVQKLGIILHEFFANNIPGFSIRQDVMARYKMDMLLIAF